jgi:hypothetical protein
MPTPYAFSIDISLGSPRVADALVQVGVQRDAFLTAVSNLGFAETPPA